MKLVSSTAGWVSVKEKLYWTRDSGASWTDITPIQGFVRVPKFDNVFFLNDSRAGSSSPRIRLLRLGTRSTLSPTP